jgi:hypothetical protein
MLTPYDTVYENLDKFKSLFECSLSKVCFVTCVLAESGLLAILFRKYNNSNYKLSDNNYNLITE